MSDPTTETQPTPAKRRPSGVIVGSNHVERQPDGDGNLGVFRGILNNIPQEEYELAVRNVLRDVATLIGSTLGPNGWTILLTEPFGASPVFPAADGFRCLINMKYDSPVYHSILAVLRDVSARMNQKVGDGTTSGNVFIRSLYDALLAVRDTSCVDRTIAPKSFRFLLKELEHLMVSKLKESYVKALFDVEGAEIYSHEETMRVLTRVATIAGNNEEQLGKDVAGVFERVGYDAVVNVEVGMSEETEFLEDTGFELTSGYLEPNMVTSSDGVHVEYNDPFYMLIDGPLTGNDIFQFKDMVDHVCVKLGQPLIVICSSFTNEYRAFFKMARAGVVQNEGTDKETVFRYPICVVIEDSTGSTVYSSRFMDIAAILGATPFPTQDGVLQGFNTMNKSTFMGMLGRSTRFKGSPYTSYFIGGHGKVDIIAGRIVEIEKEIFKKSMNESLAFQSKIAVAKKRIAMLRGKMVTVRVGGPDYKTKQYFQLVYEDAFSAVRSAIENGFTLGGNLAIAHCIHNNFDTLVEEFYSIVKSKKVHLLFGNPETAVRALLTNLLRAVADSSTMAFATVLVHHGLSAEEISTILVGLTGEGQPYQTLNAFTGLQEPLDLGSDLLVAGNTDTEMISAVFTVCSSFISSRNMMLMYHPGQQQS